MNYNETTEFDYDEMVMKPLLKIIEDNQEYFCGEDPVSSNYPNLPELAKIGYMFNVLFYTGRICYGHNGRIQKNGSSMCEDNPRYLIQDHIDYIDLEIEDFCYDAWGMHVDDDSMNPSYATFIKNMSGKELTPFDRKLIKTNKTFDEWVEILTDPQYRYHKLYPNRKAVANTLLSSIGTGYGYKNGFVIDEASGAGEDSSLYANWENAKLSPKIKSEVDKILSYPQIAQAMDIAHNVVQNSKKEYRDNDPLLKSTRDLMDLLKKKMGEEEWEKLEKERQKKQEEEDRKYKPYYPICEYSNITKFDKNTHPSYIKAAIEVCEDILAHEEEELKSFHGSVSRNVEFAKRFLKKFSK